jgi:DNA-binding CsgD family transcriptional regulator
VTLRVPRIHFTEVQAAAMLGISPRTAETQLQSVYRKLGIGTRAELAIEYYKRRNDADSQTQP